MRFNGKLNHGIYIVRITVSQPEALKDFAVHTDLVCRSCESFQKAFNVNFIGVAEAKLALPYECPVAFEAFYDWLYSGTVGASQIYPNASLSLQTFWFEAYRMADSLLIKDALMDENFQDLVYHRFQ